MKKLAYLFAGILLLFTIWQCKNEVEKPQEGVVMIAPEIAVASPDAAFALQYFEPLPDMVENPDNVLTDDKVYLGKVLYYDTTLSDQGNNSCNSCHNLQTYGVDNLPTSPGDKGELGGRNSPTVLNAAIHTMQFWDGRAKDVEEQAGGPILNPVEMAMASEDMVIDRLKGLEYYRDLFGKAFPGESDPITYKNVQKAIGAFERTLVTKSRFDDFMEGDSKALTDQEIKGMKTFVEVGCVTCHSGAALGGHMFQKFGVYENYVNMTGSQVLDEGLKAISQEDKDQFIFKVPSLRNIEKTYPYFHDGSVDDLSYAIRIMGKVQGGIDLTGVQIADITAFLNTLTGDVPEEAKQIPKEIQNKK